MKNDKNYLAWILKKRSTTDDRLRASFYLHDGLDDKIILVPANLAGERTDARVVVLNKHSNTLAVDKLKDLKQKDTATFDIVDVVKNMSVITRREDVKESRSKKRCRRRCG